MDAAVHAIALGFAVLLGESHPAIGLVIGVGVVASSVFQPRFGPLLKRFLPRGRSYNLLLRRGAGARRVVAFAFVDAPRGLQRFVAPTSSVVFVLAGIAAVGLLLRWGDLDASWLVALLRVVAAGLLVVGLFLASLARARVVDADGDALKRLVALGRVPLPDGVELVLAACGSGFPNLDGLAALHAQHGFDDAEWWPLGRRQAAAGWLRERELRLVDPARALDLLGPEYDAGDVVVDHERARRVDERDGDHPGG